MNFLNAKHLFVSTLLCVPVIGSGAVIQNFDTLNGYAAGPDNRLLITRERVLQDLGASTDSGVSFRYRYLDREIDPSTERFRRETDGSGLRSAFFWGQGEWGLGFEADYEDLDTRYLELNPPPGAQASRGAVDTEGYQFALNLLGQHEGWRFGVQAGFGYAEHDATRKSDAGISVTDYDSQEFFALVRVERVFRFDDGLALTPFAALSTTRVETDGFEESGSPDRRIVEGFSFNEHLGLAGVRLSKNWGGATPALSVAWVQRLSSDSYDLASSINGLEAVGRVKSPYTGLLALGLSVEIPLAFDWWLRPEGRYLNGGDDEQWTFGVGVGRTL